MKRPRMIIAGIVVGLIALSAVAYGLASANDDASTPAAELANDTTSVETHVSSPDGTLAGPAAPLTDGSAAAGSTCLVGATTCADNPAVAPVAPVAPGAAVPVPGEKPLPTGGGSSNSNGMNHPTPAMPPDAGVDAISPSDGVVHTVPASPPSVVIVTPIVPTDPNGSVSSPPQTHPSPPPFIPTPTTAPPSKPGVVKESGRDTVPAPIDGAEVIVMESSPAQYAVKVTAGLPGGCAKPAGYEIERTGDLTTIIVYDSLPTGPVACTAIYGSYSLTVPLPLTFVSGKSYTVIVGNKTVSFTAQ